MVCLIKSRYKKELNHYASILGSEEAAYYVLAANNGYTLDKTPNGEPSALYNALLEYRGGEEEAVLGKAVAYTPQFFENYGNWTETNGEPSIVDLAGGYLSDGKDLSEVLEDNGKFVETCHALEQANILDHSLAILSTIGACRDEYAAQYLKQWLKDHSESNKYEQKNQEFIAKSRWTIDKINTLMGKTQRTLAERFGLIRTEQNGKIVYVSKSKDSRDQLRVEFVNSLTVGDYVSQDGVVKKGVFYDKKNTDAMYSLIQISLEDGDPSTFIHELSHSYIRQFWNSNVVQNALKEIDNETPGRLTSRDLEEILAEDITNKVLNKKSSGFWRGIRKIFNILTAGLLFKDKQDIRDLISSYFIMNRDLSYDEAEQITYSMYIGPMYSSRHNITEREVFKTIVNGLKRKIKALQATDPSSANIARTKQNIQRAEARNANDSQDVQATVEDFLNQAIDEICEAEHYLANIQQNGLSSLDPREFMNILNNVIKYYQVTLDDYINPLTQNNKTSYLAPNTTLYNQYDQIRSITARISSLYYNILGQYIDKTIEDFVEQNVDVGDRARIAQNMKYWIRNEIEDGKLQAGELIFGGTTSSRSPIVRMVEFMVSSANTTVRIQTNTIGHILQSLYNACKPKVSMSNFMKTFIELDRTGKPTGYFLRDINYGQFYRDRDAFIEKLDAKYGVQVEIDSRGNEERVWPDDYAWRNYQDELDDWLDLHSNRKFTAEYYKDRRKYMSRDTLAELDYIQDRINTIKNKCIDPTTGIPFMFELSVEDRQELRKLEQDKEQLANPYIIVLDVKGNVVSIQPKSGDALRMANEIRDYRRATGKRFHYTANRQKYAQIEKYIRDKYGDSSIEMSRFKYDYLSTIINPELWDIVGQMIYSDTAEAKRLLELQYRKNAILRICYNKKGEFVQPNLSVLNEDAFKELKTIDEEITRLALKQGIDFHVHSPFDVAFFDVFTKNPVMYDDETTYFDHLLTEAHKASQHNPNAVSQFYDTYTYINKDGSRVPLRAFFYTAPIQKNIKIHGKSIEAIIQSPTGALNEINDDSSYRNLQWDPTDSSAIQPLRKDKDGNVLYDNSDKYNEIMSDKAKRVFYKKLLDIMDKAYKKLPHYHDRAKYLMPQIADKDLGRLAGGWRDIVAAFTKWGGIDDDIEINMSQTLSPIGTPVNMIPIRWNRLNKSIKLNTDVLYTVIAFSKMAAEYEQKVQIAPIIEAFIEESRNSSIGNYKQTDQTKKLEDYADMQIYGNLKKPLTKERFGNTAGDIEKRLSLFFGGLMEISHMKLMSRNLRAVAKNLLDSIFTALAEISGKKYFTFKDFAYSIHYAFKDIIKAASGIGNPNTSSKLAAAMQFTGAAETVDSLFQHQKNSTVLRLFKRFFCMGEYTLVDYLIKGVITGMTFHHTRLVYNPLTKKDEFMTQDQIRYAYTAAGLNKEEGSKKWSESNITLWDAYTIDKRGNFVLDSKYEDIVRPLNPVTGKRSNKIETRIAGTIRERGSVVNGILDSSNRGGGSRNYLFAALLQMRGWMVTHFFDYFKNGSDFAEYVRAYDSSKNLKQNVKDSEQLIKESEDVAYAGQYNFETGTIERGVYRGLHKAVSRWLIGSMHLNRVLNTNKCTDNEKYQVRRLNAVLVGLFIACLLTIITGKKLEKDKEDKLMNYLYTISVATVSERATTVPGVQVLTTLDVIRTPIIAYTLVEDFSSITELMADGYEASTYNSSEANYAAEYKRNITHGTYKNMLQWQKNALKTNAELYPYINVNNIYRSISPESNKSSANYYRQIFPTNKLSYKPKINKTKNNDNQSILADVWDYFTNVTNQ